MSAVSPVAERQVSLGYVPFDEPDNDYVWVQRDEQ